MGNVTTKIYQYLLHNSNNALSLSYPSGECALKTLIEHPKGAARALS
jgi:hypothetical protein